MVNGKATRTLSIQIPKHREESREKDGPSHSLSRRKKEGKKEGKKEVTQIDASTEQRADGIQMVCACLLAVGNKQAQLFKAIATDGN